MSPPEEYRFFTASALPLRSDESGSRYWSVSLKHTMLSYFEVPPHTRFPQHQHESEQITHVLEGTFSFQFGDVVVRLEAGDTIAVHANAPHSVFTEAAGAKAVDAWSPVPSQYASPDTKALRRGGP